MRVSVLSLVHLRSIFSLVGSAGLLRIAGLSKSETRSQKKARRKKTEAPKKRSFELSLPLELFSDFEFPAFRRSGALCPFAVEQVAHRLPLRSCETVGYLLPNRTTPPARSVRRTRDGSPGLHGQTFSAILLLRRGREGRRMGGGRVREGGGKETWVPDGAFPPPSCICGF